MDGTNTYMPVMPANGGGFDMNGGWWIILLFLFMGFGGGFHDVEEALPSAQLELFSTEIFASTPAPKKNNGHKPKCTCPGCKFKKPLEGMFLHNGIYCNVMDWEESRPYRYTDIIRDNMERQRQRDKARNDGGILLSKGKEEKQ